MEPMHLLVWRSLAGRHRLPRRLMGRLIVYNVRLLYTWDAYGFLGIQCLDGMGWAGGSISTAFCWLVGIHDEVNAMFCFVLSISLSFGIVVVHGQK